MVAVLASIMVEKAIMIDANVPEYLHDSGNFPWRTLSLFMNPEIFFLMLFHLVNCLIWKLQFLFPVHTSVQYLLDDQLKVGCQVSILPKYEGRNYSIPIATICKIKMQNQHAKT